MKLRLASPRYLIDLGQVPGLRGVRVDGENLIIGALTTHADILSSDVVRGRIPGLAEAASVIGDVQVRNRGTIGGSVAHADPGRLSRHSHRTQCVFYSRVAIGSRTISVDDFLLTFTPRPHRQ